ncbi:MAG: hypothetical protein OZSIB_3882 [Candidatus Ozemobacter sibiricus]|uniref:Uncharacterized protein n=1 Tax=Candidatus Ozemobacter sibiricus TaxID=2268124 RepID=A0A367ZPI2_9BACT|nr:MAG: hypothetical protein OZSIB_3882 [Candidatus Ozemobacter sibiricus]
MRKASQAAQSGGTALILLLGMMTASSQVAGCDDNLLRLLARSQKPTTLTTRIFDLAEAAARLAGALGTIETARPAGQAVWHAWTLLESAFTPFPAAASSSAFASLSGAVATLRTTLEQENLLAAHDLVKTVFYSSLACLPREDLPLFHRHLLEAALALQEIQALAVARQLADLGPALGRLLPILEKIPDLCSPPGKPTANHLILLGRRLLTASDSSTPSEDQLLMGISLMKDEFAVLLRTLANDLATPSSPQ